jgi:WD40 repeat protein
MNDEHVAQYRRNVRIRNGVIAAIGLMLAISVIASVRLWFSRKELRRALDDAVQQRNASESRRLAALSAVERNGGRVDVAVLLASEGLQFAKTAEARSSLLASLEQFVGKEAIISCTDCEISEMSFRQTEEALPHALLAIGTARGDVLLRDLTQVGPLVATGPPIHRAAINSMAFNPAGTLLASAGVGADSQLVIWKVGDSFDVPPLKAIAVYPGVGWAVAFSPDGHKLATAGRDGSVRLAEVKSSDIRFQDVMRGHSGFVFSLASAGTDGTIRIWDVAKAVLAYQPIKGHRGTIGRVAFSPDWRAFSVRRSRRNRSSLEHLLRETNSRTACGSSRPRFLGRL